MSRLLVTSCRFTKRLIMNQWSDPSCLQILLQMPLRSTGHWLCPPLPVDKGQWLCRAPYSCSGKQDSGIWMSTSSLRSSAHTLWFPLLQSLFSLRVFLAAIPAGTITIQSDWNHRSCGLLTKLFCSQTRFIAGIGSCTPNDSDRSVKYQGQRQTDYMRNNMIDQINLHDTLVMLPRVQGSVL